MNEPNETNEPGRAAQTTWRSQPLDAPRLTVQFVKYQAERLDADRKREIGLWWAALATWLLLAATVILNPQGIFGPMQPTLQLVSVLLLAGCTYGLYQMKQRSRVAAAQVDGLIESLSAYRSELSRRRDLYRDAWRGWIWPFLPALVVTFVGGGLYDDRPGKLWRYGLAAVVAIVGTALGAIHYRRRGDRFQRELDALSGIGDK